MKKKLQRGRGKECKIDQHVLDALLRVSAVLIEIVDSTESSNNRNLGTLCSSLEEGVQELLKSSPRKGYRDT